MSNNKKRKKSTNKYKKLDTSKLIPIIAVVEVIVLVAVTTFAWFFFNASKSVSSGIVTVNADSGLEIDFKDADKSSYIDIFDYVDENQFRFEPATSVDGRNIYFPTSGTFGNTDTESMVFRDGTINDINSKYINIDFTLTNNSGAKMDVFLSHNSFFHSKNKNSEETINGKALRMALYNNDGNTGNVDSDIINNINNNKKRTDDTVSADNYTIYFKEGSWGDHINAFIWDAYGENENNKSIYSYTDVSGTKHYLKADGTTDTTNQAEAGQIHQQSAGYHSWPGSECVKYESLYSFSFDNPQKSISVDRRDSETGKTITYTYYSETERLYDSIIFNNNSNQTVDINFYNTATPSTTGNGNCYTLSDSQDDSNHYNVTKSSDADDTKLITVYFLKPTDWGDNAPYCRVATSSIGDDDKTGGVAMTQVATAVYSYTFPAENTNIKFISNGRDNACKNRDISSDANDTKPQLYYFPSDGPSAKVFPITFSSSNIYFYNTLGWEQPYAHVNAFADGKKAYLYDVPMIGLSGNLYYCPLATPFLYDTINKSTETYQTKNGDTKNVSSLATNCEVYFTDSKNDDTASLKEQTYGGNIYRVTSVGAKPEYENYTGELSVTEDSYAVISPGVSAGFQRAANPVSKINYATGAVENIVPTFASSFDDFLMGSNNPVFSIDAGKTVNMSMIIWLEGTDPHCTGKNYAGKDINLKLEFSTVIAGDAADGTFSYRFIDATREHWTSDTQTNTATGVSISPVMQLYDLTEDRGYLMKSETNVNYNGAEKVYTWTCQAPQSLVYSDHKFEFRRVNPYNEDQIWNRWQAGEMSKFRGAALEQSTRSVNFTAFGDGSPDYDIAQTNGFTVPLLSCGGLWGRHNTETIYVYDGRKDRSFGTNGVLNMGYSYKYGGSGDPIKLETKGSYTYGNFYAFVVPSDIYENATDCYFRNYENLESNEAVNSKANRNIGIKNEWESDYTSSKKVGGPFYALNEENGKTEKHSYWGSDVIYIQISEDVSDSYSSNAGFTQVHFYKENDDSVRGVYTYLYENDSFKASQVKTAFAAVVPCGYEENGELKVFDSFDIQRLPSNKSHTYRYTGRCTFIEGFKDDNPGSETYTHGRVYHKITPDSTSGSDNRIIKITWDIVELYYNQSTYGQNYSKGEVHYYDKHSNGEHTANMEWYDKQGKDEVYKAFIPSDASKYYFKFPTPNTYSKDYEDDGKAVGKYASNVLYYPTAYEYGKVVLTESSPSYGENRESAHNDTDYTTHPNNGNWPEYTKYIVR